MSRVLLVTNDFPPRRGGIQSYLGEFVGRLVDAGSHSVLVYAPQWKGADAFDADAAGYRVVRHPGTLMLPVPTVDARMRRLIGDHGIDTVWFGAAAPLALLAARARRAGASRVLASTHGHEVGWSMLPVARSVLRRIGDDTDVVTFVSRYTRGRFATAFGPAASLEYLPSGVDTDRFQPDPAGRDELRKRYGLGERPTAVCLSRLVPRKGQDMLIKALPSIRQRVDGAALVIVGSGPYLDTLRKLAQDCGVADHVTFTGGVPSDELPAHYALADVFAMPCRTRGAGMDVEGLGIVFLEASAAGVPVIAGDSGGAPEAVQHNKTGLVVDGNSVQEVGDAVAELLGDRDRATAMGAAGRDWVTSQWRWDILAARLANLLRGKPSSATLA
ncbi:GDP-mannose-dependent alpha-(1-6)-phosphatidylinositol monomannoside mannosyltransferase [Mycobacterium montefiorense]|uniref:GDP-mannose-dependent alpha-(1-6)-phosphatidylinositol monomannoside mannosyltransferase n=1 Tax=Mycobacterium montefiorense TaxID=154654 RepID=A0AA37UW64_9MYCO|nr:GDP-mannose-dependent alpha-(1-6)-phosphatidylinositol monomannoside mannosyltransferase [Mycobacterium montefiorense]GBG37194.1 GDP-mannose-dependent alpha-(1-6)-phosphatidylinositol monomannoside mannosyltransferase [Mycobacterium montefiorense]GKU34094.1 GDP-mannose-dependent alpha-(1-6)-phosphatidylinositol monomannoside mannosyltransferase [Mycobacterium montefiorense]GKU39663.1 GDP-mannose-dependent alpha-(1-6)-phosphatidylinositol monomannoside mannosyltransferase [Mycobacterium montef